MLFIIMVVPESQQSVFLYLYEKYKHLMLRKAAYILGDPVLAEDAVSEAFIRIYKNMSKIDDPDSGRCAAFVFTVVKNTALTLRKKETAYIAVDDEAVPEQKDEFNLEEKVLSEMSAEHIMALLDGINEDLRQVFLLKYGYDLSHREISNILHITENNVTVRLHRAKTKIAEILTKEKANSNEY